VNFLYIRYKKIVEIMTPQWLNSLKEQVSQLEAEAVKFYEKGNKSAGTRTRKLLQEIKATCQEGRTHVQESKVEPTV
jgi:hypothetical protein